jgi:hypothetical protein
VHVDYDGTHDVFEEHKPLYEEQEAKEPLIQRVKERLGFKSRAVEAPEGRV